MSSSLQNNVIEATVEKYSYKSIPGLYVTFIHPKKLVKCEGFVSVHKLKLSKNAKDEFMTGNCPNYLSVEKKIKVSIIVEDGCWADLELV
jgi:hypothetical protein